MERAMTDKDNDANPNSPEKLLGSWLTKMSDLYSDYDFDGDDYDSECSSLLANILSFADDHKKIVEMLQWLDSGVGYEFINSEKYLPAGNMVSIKIDVVKDFLWDAELDLLEASPEEHQSMVRKLQEWVEINMDYCRHQLTLN
jgi:hypothetical protein